MNAFRPLFPDWLGWFLVACAFVAFILLLGWCENEAASDCERRGGTYVHTGRYNSVCFKRGVVVE